MRKNLLTALLALTSLGASAELQRNADGYYLIGTAAELTEFSMFVRSGQLSVNAMLTADIDMAGMKGYYPIGLYSDTPGYSDHNYSGTFDGAGHVIKNLSLVMDDPYEVGVIGRANGATIKNLGVIDSKFVSNSSIRVGAIGGELNNCRVINCYSYNVVLESDNEQKGGIAGEAANSATFTNCFTNYETLCPAIGGGTVNSYSPADYEGMLPGELCYLLNGDQSTITFYQKVGTDELPSFDASRGQVYAQGDMNCNGEPLGGDITYSNTIKPLPPHEYDADGYCVNCGGAEPAVAPAEDGWYEITSGRELRNISRFVNAGNSKINIRLMNDIDMDGVMMEPIGTYNDNGTQIAFQGTFDGQNHIIYNLIITVESGEEAGLFGRINGGGTLKNLGVVNAHITNTASIRAGVLVGECHASNLFNCFTAGDITIDTDHDQKGGIAAEAASTTIVNCYTSYDRIATSAGGYDRCWAGEVVEDNVESGALAWMMNGNTFVNPTWYQDVDEEAFPVLDPTHGIVYKTGDETYASAKNDAQFAELLPELIQFESDTFAQKIATKTLLNNYVSSLAKLESSTQEGFTKSYTDLNKVREAIATSEAAYAAYVAKVNEIKTFLEENNFSGDLVDQLKTYLTDAIEPCKEFPNGTAEYIVEQLKLTTTEINAETEFAQGLLDTVIEKCYQPGSDITNMLANADFSNSANGWQCNVGVTTLATCNGYKNALSYQNCEMDLNQTLTGLTPGYYLVKFKGYAEQNGVGAQTQYNYGSFVYANEQKNYWHTKFTSLFTEEELEGLPGVFGPVYDTFDNYIGHGAGSLDGLCACLSLDHYDNTVIANVGEDGTLKLGAQLVGMYGQSNGMFVSDARVIYLGGAATASEALNEQLTQMVETANHILNDYMPDLFYEAPNFSEAIKAELAKAVAEAEAATTAEDMYAATGKLGGIFQTILDNKNAYIELMTVNDQLYSIMDQVASPEVANQYEAEYYVPIIENYEAGNYSTDQALALVDKIQQNEIYLSVFGIEPEKEGDVYLCSSPYNLVWVSKKVNDGNSGLQFALTADIDMSPIKNFTPIGLHRDDDIQKNFTGKFDGRGHIIKNLSVEISDGCEAGFISRASSNAVMQNVGFVNAHIVNGADVRAGVLVGEAHVCTINNVFSVGDIVVDTTHPQIGGLCGEANSTTLTNCYTTYYVVANGAGGLVNCYDADEAESLLESGELCFKLNGDQSNIRYYQKLGEDKYPTLDSSRGQVYAQGDMDCGGNALGEVAYTNNADLPSLPPHTFDAEGICEVCGHDRGAFEPDEDGVYHITTPYELRWYAAYVNAGHEVTKAELNADIDMTGITTMTTIGKYSDDANYPNVQYRGTFDGKGHEIRNLSIVIPDTREAGLFSRCAASATIKNLGLVNPHLSYAEGVNNRRMGAFVGELNNATLINCYVVGDDIQLNTENLQRCSLAGEASGGVLTNCFTTLDLGFTNLGTVKNCYNAKTIEGIAETGELCYNLNEKTVSNTTWRQNLGEDKYPVLNTEHKIVYILEDGSFSNDMGNSLAQYAGTEEDPIIVKSVNDLTSLRSYLKKGEVTYIVLNNDIDMSGVENWVPLNTAADDDYQNWIDFDGQGHVISNFTCKTENQEWNSFFGVLCGGVRNLGLVDVDIDNDRTGGGAIAGYLGHWRFSGTTYVLNTYVTGKLNVTSSFCGGLFGHVDTPSIIRNCYTNMDITGGSNQCGGLVGEIAASLTIENCYAAGTCVGNGIVGGVTGNAATTVYQNVAVWNNELEDFGPTRSSDKKSGIIYYNGENFAQLQQAVVAWEPSTWSVTGDEYPVLVAQDDPTAVRNIATTTLSTDAVYSIQGVRLGNTLQGLPKGLYIQGGKKVMVK